MKLPEIKAKLKQLRDASPEQRSEELLKLRREQFALRMQRATGQAVKPNQFGNARKNVARLKTILREAARAAGEKK
jgi:large subunit ribosomal protein L29